MCGIIGYIGSKPASQVLITGLKRMEYRGYDSAGIVTNADNQFLLARAKGKVVELEQKIGPDPGHATVGIGHTRWATHGEPSERNAHPHVGGKIAIVHNGIVENHQAIRQALEGQGVQFNSETDSEVLAWLIDRHYEQGDDLKLAVQEALAQVEGTFGLVIMASDRPDELIVARRGSPIIVGRAGDQVFIASDAAALAGYADEIVYLEDDDLAVCTREGFELSSLAGAQVMRDSHTLDIPVATIQKNGFGHFMLKEIHEQPEAVRSVMRGRLRLDEGTSHLGGPNLSDKQLRGFDCVFITGCGTAYYAGLMAKYYLEKLAGVPVVVEIASEFRYRQAVLPKNSVGLVVSQSGETADTLAAVRELKQRGIPSVGIINAVGSTIAREDDGGVYLHAGPEISVASTKAFTSQVTAMLLFGLQIGRKRGLSLPQGQEVVQALDRLPADMEQALTIAPRVEEAAKRIVGFDNAFYLGRGTLYPIALEGALKLKEVSYVHAEAFAAGEMKHGPIALLDDKTLVVYLLGKGPLYDKSVSNLAEVQARGTTALVITDSPEYAAEHTEAIYVPTESSWTAPLLMNVALQLLAYYVARERGCEIDQPRNLAKSVTVE